jgi:hypothetical protein
MANKKYIEVRFQFEGAHCWPNAPDSVLFLRTPHRHVFHVRARMDVNHNDREIEFILVKRHLQQNMIDVFRMSNNLLPTSSCEEMAEYLCEYIKQFYKRTSVEVEVSEDGENGAVVVS